MHPLFYPYALSNFQLLNSSTAPKPSTLRSAPCDASRLSARPSVAWPFKHSQLLFTLERSSHSPLLNYSPLDLWSLILEGSSVSSSRARACESWALDLRSLEPSSARPWSLEPSSARPWSLEPSRTQHSTLSSIARISFPHAIADLRFGYDKHALHLSIAEKPSLMTVLNCHLWWHL